MSPRTWANTCSILSAVKTEFDKFAGVISATQNRLKQANDELDKLVGTRTRQIQRSLRDISTLNSEDSERILELTSSISSDDSQEN